MRRIETNDFVITNLKDLSSQYRLFRIRGLNWESELYYVNWQNIIRRLSRALKKPVTIIEKDRVPHLVVRNDAIGVPYSQTVVKGKAYFDPLDGVFPVDYTLRTPENDEICLRFLQFWVQERLYANPELWQPRSGGPFFKYRSDFRDDGIAHYIGCSVRVVAVENGRLALRIHVANKYVGIEPLPAILGRDEFEQWKGRSHIYHFGHQWYEVKAKSLSELNVMEYPVPCGRETLPLLEYVVAQSRKPIPPELARVPVDGTVITYLDNRRNEKGVPSALCYPVYSAHDGEMKWIHRRSQMPPDEKRSRTLEFVRRYLMNLQSGSVRLNIDPSALTTEPRMFQVPDVRFGNSRVLSVRGTKGAIHTSLDELGQKRAALLKDRRAGFYDTDPLDRQYLILPKTVMDSYGSRFVKDLSEAVDRLFPQEHGWQPDVIVYNDLVKRTMPHQGHAILEAVREKCKLPGYAVVMIHEIKKQKVRDEDELAAMVVREMRKLNLKAAVIHTTVSQESYRLVTGANGDREYVPRESKQRGKLSGYLQGVALVKVLLNNQRWPFVLETRLHADLVIGIDVKNNTAGLVVVGHNEKSCNRF